MNESAPADLSGLYDDRFYQAQVAESLASARIYLGYLWPYLPARSVLDVGCGRGAWLKACRELGSTELHGLDGSWNESSKLIDGAIRFRSIDLNRPFSLKDRVDLAMTLEVAEHLEPASSGVFVECLSAASDAVLFGAAYSGQGGTHHINEQPHTFWASLFARLDYAPFDLFRPVFWANEDVCYWYRQNTFLYLKRDSASYRKLVAQGFAELRQIAFMDCIHPALYRYKLHPQLDFRDDLGDLLPSFLRGIRRRMKARKPLA
jgi:SAM-dependent methyltransferase